MILLVAVDNFIGTFLSFDTVHDFEELSEVDKQVVKNNLLKIIRVARKLKRQKMYFR